MWVAIPTDMGIDAGVDRGGEKPEDRESLRRGSVNLVYSDRDGEGLADACSGFLTSEKKGDGSSYSFVVDYFEDGNRGLFETVFSGNESGVKEKDQVDAHDMTSMGTRLMEAVEQSKEDESGLIVCFDSLNDLLRHNDEESSYVFMHLLTGKLRSAGAVGHVHVDPDGVGEKTVGIFEHLFDTTETE